MRKILLVVAVVLLVVSGLAGCKSDPYAATNELINAESIYLGQSDADVQKALGGEGEVAPCVAGYERGYDEKALNIGFDQEKATARRITMKDAKYSFDGISPTMTMEEGASLLTEKDFEPEAGSKSRFVKEGIRVILKSIKGEVIDEVTVEIQM